MEVKEFNVQETSTLLLGQQYDHNVTAVLFTGLLYPDRNSYLKVYDGKKTELIPLSMNLLKVGRPLTDKAGDFPGQIVTLDEDGEEIKNSRVFRMRLRQSLGEGELIEYPVPPNFETKYNEMVKFIRDVEEKIEAVDISREESTNILDPGKIIDDKSYSYNTGVLRNLKGFCCSELIPAAGRVEIYVNAVQFVYFDKNKTYITGGGCHEGFSDYWIEDTMIFGSKKISKMRIPEGVHFIGLNYKKMDGLVKIASFEPLKCLCEYGKPHYKGGGVFKGLVNAAVKNSLEGKRIGILGDSLSAKTYENPTWWNMVESDTGCKFIEYTYPGTTMASMDPERGFVERYLTMDDSLDGVVVLGGTNDVGLSTPLGSWGDVDPVTFYGALNTLIKGLLTKYPGKPILFLTPIQRKDGAAGAEMLTTFEELKMMPVTSAMTMPQMRAAIMAKCQQYGIPVVDLYASSGINGIDEAGVYYRKASDSVHPSEKGLCRMANMVAAELEKLFRYEILV